MNFNTKTIALLLSLIFCTSGSHQSHLLNVSREPILHNLGLLKSYEECKNAIMNHDASFDYKSVFDHLETVGCVQEFEDLLKLAVFNGQDEAVKVMLAAGMNPNIIEGEFSALDLEVLKESPRTGIIEELVAAGAIIDNEEDYMKTALHKVIEGLKFGDKLEALEALLQGHVDFDSLLMAVDEARRLENAAFRDRATDLILERMETFEGRLLPGETLMHLACHRADYNLVELLISKGYNVNAARSDGITPIMIIAAAKPRSESSNLLRIADLLIKNNAEISGKVVDIAHCNKNKKFSKILCKKLDKIPGNQL